MIPCYAYLRVSSAGQVEGDGFTRQLQIVSTFCEERGLEILDVFKEEGVSGVTDMDGRQAFQAMMSAMMMNGCRTVVVEGLDRLAREYRVQENLLVYLASKGVTLFNARTGENVTDAILGDPMKKAMVQIQGVFSELEKNLLVKKMRAARDRKKALRGKCEGRLGYRDTDKGKDILAQIEPAAKGRSLSDAARWLNDNGITTLDGKSWTKGNLRKVLRG